MPGQTNTSHNLDPYDTQMDFKIKENSCCKNQPVKCFLRKDKDKDQPIPACWLTAYSSNTCQIQDLMVRLQQNFTTRRLPQKKTTPEAWSYLYCQDVKLIGELSLASEHIFDCCLDIISCNSITMAGLHFASHPSQSPIHFFHDALISNGMCQSSVLEYADWRSLRCPCQWTMIFLF